MGRFVRGERSAAARGFGYFFLLFGALRFLQDQFKVLTARCLDSVLIVVVLVRSSSL